MRKFIKNELSGWKTHEVLWPAAACAVIAGLSIYWVDAVIMLIKWEKEARASDEV